MLKQFNPDNTDYGRWVEQERRNLFELLRKNPYFRYSFSITFALLLAATACAKQSVDHRRAMWITAEVMADLYNQDAYSRQVAQEAIERYNKHIERCNRAIEAGESLAVARGPYALPRRETRQREIATLPEKSCGGNLRSWREMSVRLDTRTNKPGASAAAKMSSDLRGADAKLGTHINNPQEQLFVERNNNRRLKGG
jgi:hypothetical protein